MACRTAASDKGICPDRFVREGPHRRVVAETADLRLVGIFFTVTRGMSIRKDWREGVCSSVTTDVRLETSSSGSPAE